MHGNAKERKSKRTKISRMKEEGRGGLFGEEVYEQERERGGGGGGAWER